MGMQHQAGGNQYPQQNLAIDFKPSWIKEGIDDDTVSFSERLGKYLVERRMTTSQIRNIFGEIKRIQMKGFDKDKSAFFLLRAKMAYATKRGEGDGIKAFKEVFDVAHKSVSDSGSYQNFVDFFEAVLAYHKAFGGN